MTEDKIVGWHHQLNVHEFEQTLGDSEGQGSLECCSPWDCKESDMIQQLNNSNNTYIYSPPNSPPIQAATYIEQSSTWSLLVIHFKYSMSTSPSQTP